jgi:dUTP pyrophosphatase
MNIYLASPIDQGRTDTNVTAWRAEAKERLQCAGFSVFDPSQAFNMQGEYTNWPELVNVVALESSDAVLALLPRGTASIGVPIEIKRALDCGIPVAVVHDHTSYTLMGLDVPVFPDVASAVHWLEQEPAAEVSGYSAKVAGHGEVLRVHQDDAGFDLAYAGAETLQVRPWEVVDVPCGVALEWPYGMWALLIGRSSSFKNRGLLVNPSVIDAGYRGDMFVIVRNVGSKVQHIEPGERLAQLVPFPTYAAGMGIERVEHRDLSTSERGDAGFGSTGL